MPALPQTTTPREPLIPPPARTAFPARCFPPWPLAWTLAAAHLALPAAADTRGVPWTGEAGITESVATLSARDSQQRLQGTRPARHKPVLRPDRRALPQDPDATAVPAIQSTAKVQSPAAFAPQVLGTSFTGATLADTGAYPPDTMGAVGPTQFIVAINGRIRSFNKTTGVADGALNHDMDVFFNSVMTPPTSSNFTSDPHIRYDRLSGRWFVVMIDVPGSAGALPNRVLLAVSSGGTITNSSSFTFFYFQHDLVAPTGDTGNFADYPTLGIDNNALYIGDNVFSSSGSFVGCSGFVVRKSSLLGAGPIVVTAFRGLVPGSTSEGPFTPQGVDNYDPAATEGYFIGISNITKGRLVVRRVSTPGTTPTISSNISLTVPSTQSPITVPHLGNTGGTSGNLDPVDDRLFAAHLRNGRLWTAHNIQVNSSGTANRRGGRNGSRWYEIQNLTGTPGIVQSGTVFDPASSNPKSYWIPTIMVSGQGHAAMGFSTAGANNRANAGTVGRLAGDAAGTMQTPADYTASSTAYNPPGDPGGTGGRRWGDFSFTSLDPNDDMTMWTIQEFCDSTNSYGVRAVKLSAPPPATPAACSPSTLSIGQASVLVTVSGTQVAGSGFFDPGTGFANRITAAVGGGVLINSITYISPTSVTLDLNTTGATAGAQAVTVTNPDAQASTSSTGILTIVGNASVVALNRANADPSNAGTANWLLTFDVGVTGMTAANFSLTGSAATGAALATPTTVDGGLHWNVPVTTGPSSGTLTLSLDNAAGLSPPIASTLPWTGQSYTMDKTTQAPTLTAPATDTITSSPVSVAFSLPETALGGSVQLVFSGAASRTLTLAASQQSGGPHSFTFNPANPTLTTAIAGITGGTSVPDGIYTVTLTYQDLLANPAASATNTNILIDTTPPVVTPPADVTVEATSAAGAVASYAAATATDAVGVTNLTYSHASGTEFPLGTTIVTATATDAANNIGTATFTVKVQDTTAPVVTPPADVTVEAASAAGAVASYAAATATDAVGVTDLTYSHASGTEFPLGTTIVTATATDAANNIGTATFTVKVQDTTAPVVTPPANVTVEATSAAGAIASYAAATATDAVGVTDLTYSHASGTEFPLGTTIVTATATDTANNIGTATFTVKVQDSTAPVVTPPADVTVEATSAAGAVASYAAATATDAVGVTDLTYSHASGTEFPLGTTIVTATATDAANNIGTATFTVTVTEVPLTPLQSWRELHFNNTENAGAGADNEDPNGNGIVNLVEYALGGDPAGATTGTTILPKPGHSAGNALEISFTRYADRTDLLLIVQAADSLDGPWTDLVESSAGAPFVVMATGANVAETGTGNARNVTATDLYPATDPAHPLRFMRLRVVNVGL